MREGTFIIVAVFLLLPLTAFRAVSANYSGNYCLSFNGTSAYVNMGNSSVFECFQLTIEAWVKPKYDIRPGSDAYYGHTAGVIATRRYFSSVESHGGWVLFFDYSLGKLNFGFTESSAGGSNAYYATPTYWNSSLWYFIAVTYDPIPTSNNLNFYVNGVLDSSYNESHAIYYENYPLLVGGQRARAL
jgi:hypothetical protein